MTLPFSDSPHALALVAWIGALALAVVGGGGWIFLMVRRRRACAWGRAVQVRLLCTLGPETRGVGGVSYPVWVSPSAPGKRPYPFAAAGILIHGPEGVRVVAEFGSDDRPGQPLTWDCAAPHPGGPWPLAVATHSAGRARYLALTAPRCPPLYVYQDRPDIAAGRPDPVLTRALGQALAAPPGPPPSAALVAFQRRFYWLVQGSSVLMGAWYALVPRPPVAQPWLLVALWAFLFAALLAPGRAVARAFIQRGMGQRDAWLFGLLASFVLTALLGLPLPWILQAAYGQ